MDKVLVLMSTYNGEKYLVDQIESVLSQSNVDVDILIRDDGSTDGTIEILKSYSENGKINWYRGDNLRPAHSFMDLINKAGEYPYYAFCDQDDIWLEDKLYIAITEIKSIDDSIDIPILYYGQPRFVDESLKKNQY